MGYNAGKAEEVYKTMVSMGYDPGLCEVVSRQMCTDWTAMRILGYLHQCGHVKEEEFVDEMLAILGDRDRIAQKYEMEFYQGIRYYKNSLSRGFGQSGQATETHA